MIINAFTVIDAFNQFWKVWETADRRSLTYVGLYFYLVKKWNVCGRPNVVRLQNNLICAELEISKPTLDRARNWLKQNRLVDFFTRGKGDSNISYEILEVVTGEVKKEKNITSNVTSSVTTGDALNKEKEEGLFIDVGGEVKNFYYLKDLWEQDAGLKMEWKKKFLPAAEFQSGVEQWMIQNNGKPYVDILAARKHFLYWIPQHAIRKLNGHKTNDNEANRRTPGASDKTKLGTSEARTDALGKF